MKFWRKPIHGSKAPSDISRMIIHIGVQRLLLTLTYYINFIVLWCYVFNPWKKVLAPMLLTIFSFLWCFKFILVLLLPEFAHVVMETKGTKNKTHKQYPFIFELNEQLYSSSNFYHREDYVCVSCGPLNEPMSYFCTWFRRQPPKRLAIFVGVVTLGIALLLFVSLFPASFVYLEYHQVRNLFCSFASLFL